MIGIILWSDPDTARAVIWCENRTGLAYLSGEDAKSTTNAFMIGDVVEFEFYKDGQKRLARSVRCVETLESGCTKLKSASSALRKPERAAPPSRVLPFRAPKAEPGIRVGPPQAKRA